MPDSVMRPSAMEMMRLAERMVLRRWAMISVVRPRLRLSKARWILASVTESRAEVASSRMQNGGIIRKIRARPPLLLAAGEQGAPLAYIGLEALGHGLDIRIDLRLPGGLDYLLIRGIGAAVANVFQNGVRKQEHILLDNADGLVEAVLLNVPHVLAVNGDAAFRYIVKSGNQLAECTLAAAGGADDGHGLPGGHVQAHIVEHRQRAVIGEADVVNPNGACYVFQGLGIRRILNGWLGAA